MQNKVSTIGGEARSGDRKPSRGARHLLLSAAAVIFIALLGPAGYAQDDLPRQGESFTDMAGSSGGSLFSRECRPGSVLVGMKGRSGIYVDRIEPMCLKVEQGKWAGSPTSLQTVGGNGGQPFEVTCPRDYVVSGFKGRAGTYIDRLQLQCKRLDFDSTRPYLIKVKGSAIDLPAVGGTGGQSFGPLNCPDYMPGYRVKGTHGQWIHSFRLLCRY
jgi:hypothetical protein